MQFSLTASFVRFQRKNLEEVACIYNLQREQAGSQSSKRLYSRDSSLISLFSREPGRVQFCWYLLLLFYLSPEVYYNITNMVGQQMESFLFFFPPPFKFPVTPYVLCIYFSFYQVPKCSNIFLIVKPELLLVYAQ